MWFTVSTNLLSCCHIAGKTTKAFKLFAILWEIFQPYVVGMYLAIKKIIEKRPSMLIEVCSKDDVLIEE